MDPQSVIRKSAIKHLIQHLDIEQIINQKSKIINRILFHKTVATAGGIGYIGKGSGTVAAVAYCIVWFFLAEKIPVIWQVLGWITITLLGVYSSNKVENLWGHDSNKVVIDEVSGMMFTLLWMPVTWQYLLAGLVLFRFFDIVKPLGIRKAENLPGGWGVMADDVQAGIYSQILMQVLLAANLF